MNQPELTALVDCLRGLPRETEWLEFKHNNADPEEIGEYLSALANEAALLNQPRGYLIFGIEDASHAVVGCRFDPYTAKAKGNQDLLPWLAAHLQPNPGIEPHCLEHPDGRVALLAVGPARGRPVEFRGQGYCRAGTSKTKLANHPEKARRLWSQGVDWSASICDGASLADLDPEAIAKAREQFQIKHPQQAKELTSWDDRTFLNKARLLRQGAITHTAVLLLGRSEAATLLSPAVAKVSWILKDAGNHELDYAHIGPPFLLAGDQLLQRLRNLTVRAMPSGTLFPQELSQYDPWVLREALHNAIAHQDYLRHGRITVV
jgi:ATP-dependent DNA helicase RecG